MEYETYDARYFSVNHKLKYISSRMFRYFLDMRHLEFVGINYFAVIISLMISQIIHQIETVIKPVP